MPLYLSYGNMQFGSISESPTAEVSTSISIIKLGSSIENEKVQQPLEPVHKHVLGMLTRIYDGRGARRQTEYGSDWIKKVTCASMSMNYLSMILHFWNKV